MKDYGQWPKDEMPIWFTNCQWIRQINRSTSIPNVCRGMHAQKGCFCQSKLVECISGSIHDIIIDARPDSKTYGRANVYHLDSTKANKLFVPKGFLHGFYSDRLDAAGHAIKQNIFQYYIGGGTYCHESEFSVSISDVVKQLRADSRNSWLAADDEIMLSDKDKDAFSLLCWLEETYFDYKQTGKLWYR